MKTHAVTVNRTFGRLLPAGIAILASAVLPWSAEAAPAAKSGDGTMSVAPSAIVAGGAGTRLTFAFRNGNRGPYNPGSQIEWTIPAGWTAPQRDDALAPGFLEVESVSGVASASVVSVSGSGPWTVQVGFTAGKGTANGFDLAYSPAGVSTAGTHSFPVQTRQAGGTFVALDASPSVLATKATAIVTLGDLVQTYDGTPRSVTVETEPAGLDVSVTYDGQPQAPIETGVYAVVATVEDPAYEGSASGLLVVSEDGGGIEPVVGLETFEYFAYTGGGYADGTFIGQDGSIWTYARARGDLSISGRSPTLEKAKGAYVRSGTIPGGVGTISLKFRKAGSQNVACGVLVNGVQIGMISGGDGSVQTWTSGPVDLPGDAVLTFTNNVNAGPITLDDVEWTGCKLPATVALSGLAQIYDGTPRAVSATTEPAGLAVAVTYAGTDVVPTSAGTYAVVATVVDDVYAGTATGTLVVAKAEQTIDFAAIPDPAIFQALNLSAAASSGLPVAFSVGFGPATMAADGSTVSFTGTGRVSIVAAQAGDGNWNAAPAVAREFDVLPALAISSDQVNVRENGEGRFFVRLNGVPASNVVASVAKMGGDEDVRIKSGATLAFGPANWNWWQTVTLAAANDEDKVGGTATFRVSLPGSEPCMVSAKELDDDVGDNLALATNGATIAGGLNPGLAVDGIHASFGNYGATVWTNDPPGAMTLTLKAPSTISRIRVMNWNWLYPVLHRYEIDSSMDGTNWTRLVDAGATDRHGWDEWEIPDQVARYLRFTGLSNSANQLVCVSEWEVIGKRVPVPANVVLQNLRQTYDGQPKQVSVQTDPPDLPVEVVYEDAGTRRRSEPQIEPAADPPVAAGIYAVVAEVADEEYEGYAEGTLVVDKADQSLAFPNPGPQNAANDLRLRATATSGLPVDFAVLDGPAILDEAGESLAFTGTGTVRVVASQAGDANWNAAADVVVSFDVTCPQPSVMLSRTNVNVREEGEGRFYVRLNMAPTAEVSIAVGNVGDDSAVAVASGSPLVFTPSNWNVWKPVVLTAGGDDNEENETTEISLSGFCPIGRRVRVTVLDDDIGENLALAARGTVASGTRAGRPEQVNDGIHAISTNYAYTLWSPPLPGTLTLDLQAVSTVSRVRLLNWDWDARSHRYTIESSVDGTTWMPLVDASADDFQGWDDWPVADAPIRYLKFTGLANSVDKGICIAEWEVYGERVLPPLVEFSKEETLVRENGEGRFFVRLSRQPQADVAVEIERSSGDADLAVQGGRLSFTPANWAVWQAVTLTAAPDDDAEAGTATFAATAAGTAPQTIVARELDSEIGVNLARTGRVSGGARAAQAVDGIHATISNYAYLNSTSVPPGSLLLDLGAVKNVSRIRLLNWDWTYRTHRFTIETSENGIDWAPLVDASGEEHQGWEEWTVEAAARFLRLTGLSNSANYVVCFPEWEVYGTAAQPASASAPSPVARTAARSVGIASVVPDVRTVLTSDGVADESGWNAVDGDWDSAWVGQKTGGGYVVVEYSPSLVLSGLEVDLAEDSLGDLRFLYSTDAQDWQPLPDDLESNPVELKYLWVIFPDDGTDAVPRLLEIYPNP